MKVERLIKHFTDGDFTDAGCLVGEELNRKRLWLLSEARTELAALRAKDVLDGNVPTYAQGYREAMCDIIFAFENAVRKEIMDMIDDPSNPTDDDGEDDSSP